MKQIMAVEQMLVCLVTILLWTNAVTCFDPISLAFGAGAAVYGTVISLVCRYKECCDSSWIPFDFTRLDNSLREHLFGQHIAHHVVLSALKAHFKENVRPKKALAFSFHGLSGTGKTYTTQFIINSLFKNGPKSKYTHFFTGRNHFTTESKADIYKVNLIDWIKSNVSACDRSLFIFDEVDKIPKGVLDAVTPFLDYHEEIDGVDFRKAIFIFLSNTGGSLIAEKLLDMWGKGTKREDIKLKDFEDMIRKGAFNEKGGLHKCESIESNVIDHYVPFLPMEESHVRQCIQAEFRSRWVNSPREEHVREVLKYMTFGPEPQKLFSNSGCKRISSKVAALMEQSLRGMDDNTFTKN
jgi:hypothetical protein